MIIALCLLNRSPQSNDSALNILRMHMNYIAVKLKTELKVECSLKAFKHNGQNCRRITGGALVGQLRCRHAAAYRLLDNA